MAQRLSRWILLTAAAAAIVALMFLTTGGTPLMFLGVTYSDGNDRDVSIDERRLGATAVALRLVRSEIHQRELVQQLQGLLRRESGDPLVTRWRDGRLEVDRQLTARALAEYAGVTERRTGIRTVVVVSDSSGSLLLSDAVLDPSGVCLSQVQKAGDPEEQWDLVGASYGWCQFAEESGLPGSGVERWRKGVRFPVSWDREPAVYTWSYRDLATADGDPAWFDSGLEAGRWAPYRGFLWSGVELEEYACLAGRLEHCGSAVGVTSAGWPRIKGRFGQDRGYFPDATMLRDLRRTLGAEKFGELWRADAPIAESYAKVTGNSIDPWVRAWATTRLGTIRRDNGLALTGWVGACLWCGLLATLVMYRLRDRTIS